MTLHRFPPHSRKVPTRRKVSPKTSGRRGSPRKFTPIHHKSINPPFPFDISPGVLGLNNVSHGYIILIDEASKADRGSVMHFLFNPQQLTYASQVLTDFLPREYRKPGDSGTPIFPGTTTLAINLFFDRSYEMYTNPQVWERGTLKDIDALSKITNFSNGFLIQNQVKAVFGGRFAPVFEGFIAGVSVSHTRFNSSMVPMTTEIAIQLTQLSKDGSVNQADPSQNTPTYTPTKASGSKDTGIRGGRNDIRAQ